MYSRKLLLLALALAIGFVPAQAAFVNNDTSAVTTLVDFDQFTGLAFPNNKITDTLINVFTSGEFAVNMNVPNYDVYASGVVVYGMESLIGSGTATDPYLISNSFVGDFGGQQALEFQLAGGAVSTIGIRLTPLAGVDVSDIRIEAFNEAGNSLDFFVINSLSNPSLANLNSAISNNDPSLGGFYGISSTASDIVRFRIVGGILALDDLGFGGLQLTGGGGPDPDPDPGVVPEASTFLLCGSVLALLSLAGRIKRFRALLQK